MRKISFAIAAVLSLGAATAMADQSADVPVSPEVKLADGIKGPSRPAVRVADENANRSGRPLVQIADENANRPGRPLEQVAAENKPPQRPYAQLAIENANRPGRPLAQFAAENKPPQRPYVA